MKARLFSAEAYPGWLPLRVRTPHISLRGHVAPWWGQSYVALLSGMMRARGCAHPVRSFMCFAQSVAASRAFSHSPLRASAATRACARKAEAAAQALDAAQCQNGGRSVGWECEGVWGAFLWHLQLFDLRHGQRLLHWHLVAADCHG